jgi:hypothetical protein
MCIGRACPNTDDQRAMRRTPRFFDATLLGLMLGALVIICLTDEDAGWHSDAGRASLALRLAWGIAVLVAALRRPVVSLARRLRDRRDARLRESNKAALLATLSSWSKPGSQRGQCSSRWEHRVAGSPVDQAAMLARGGFGEGPAPIQARESPIEATDGGMPVDDSLAIAREPIAGRDDLSAYDPLLARTFEIDVASPGRPVGHLKLDLGEGIEGFGGDLLGVVGVVDVRAQDPLEVPAAGVSAVVRDEDMAVPPHPPLDRAVSLMVEDHPDVVEQAGLGPAPAGGAPGGGAAGGSEDGITVLLVDVAVVIDDAYDHGTHRYER